MCGIIGIASNKSVSINIINALKKLEYRGYDSAGLATIANGEINEKKCPGRVEKLKKFYFKIQAKEIWDRTCKMGYTWCSKRNKCSSSFKRNSFCCSQWNN